MNEDMEKKFNALCQVVDSIIDKLEECSPETDLIIEKATLYSIMNGNVIKENEKWDQ